MKVKKERIEWIRSWCEDTTTEELPRVLLVGDSITDGYQGIVREKLRGICYVDYVATSYSVDMKIYRDLIRKLVKDSRYAIIHFNHGLHCPDMRVSVYQTQIKRLLRKLKVKRTILANSTIVYQPESMTPDPTWEKQLPKLNNAIAELARKENYPLDTLYEVSTTIGQEGLSGDGYHYTREGYEILAEAVVNKIKGSL